MAQSMDLARRAQTFLEGIGTFDSLEAVANLACTLLAAPLIICGANGAILAISPPELRDCPAWMRMAHSRRVEKELLRAALAPAASPRIWAGLTGEGKACEYMSLPVPVEGDGAPGALCVFAWFRKFTSDDEAFSAMVAAALSALMRRRFSISSEAQTDRIRLLRDLLDYKPGLKSDFERRIALEKLHDLPGAFRVACVRLDDARRDRADALIGQIARRLNGAWAFSRDSFLVCVFNEALVSPEFSSIFESFLEDEALSGCLSMGFSSLIDLRYAFENACSAWRIGSQKAPGERLYRAEDYLLLTFLYKCQRYFPIEEICPEGLKRLAQIDAENGCDYLNTLAAYLDNCLNISATAKQLFIHRNTLSQRLEKIQRMLGLPLDNPEVCLYLRICARIQAVRRM